MWCSPTHIVPLGRAAFFGRIPGNKLPGYDHPVPFGTKSDASLQDNKSPRQLSAKIEATPWRVGVLRQVRIAPRARGVGDAIRPAAAYQSRIPPTPGIDVI